MRKINVFVALGLLVAVLVGGFGFYSTKVKANDIFHPIKVYRNIEKTKQGVLKYRSANNDKIEKLNHEVNAKEQILVTITFKKPINENQLVKIVENYNLKIHHVLGRAIQKDSKKATISVQPNQDQLLNKKFLNETLKENDATFRGFIEAVAYVPNNKLKDLSDENLVFLADPSADKHLSDNPLNNFMPGLHWQLETLGMVSE